MINTNIESSINTYTQEDSSQIVRHTKIIRKKYVGKVPKRTKPGEDRALTSGGGLAHIVLFDTYNTIHERLDKDTFTQACLNLMSDDKGRVQLQRENVYWLTEQSVFSEGTNYSAKAELDKLYQIGILHKISDYCYIKGEAREGIVNKKKGLTKLYADVLCYYIDNDFLDIVEDIDNLYKVVNNKVYWKNDAIKEQVSQLIAQEYYLDEGLKEHRDSAKSLAKMLKVLQRDMGITKELMIQLSKLISPGYDRNRRRAIVQVLCDRYKVKLHAYSESDEGCSVYTEGDTEDIVEEVSVDGTTPNHTPEEETTTPAAPSPYTLPCADTHPALVPLPSFVNTLSSLREVSSQLMVASNDYTDHCYNDAMTNGVIRFATVDETDKRQKAVMLANGCLPSEYRLTSPASPRVYGQGVDNLFYARKEMRLAAMEGLGFMDVDLQNCHAEFVVARWQSHVPILKECMDKGSLWNHYQSYFESLKLPFYKGLIKAMHHATFLSGGKPAYYQAWRRYNNLHKDSPIPEGEFTSIMRAFTKSPLCAELKSLFKHIKSEWVGKVVTMPTGEKFLVKDTNWAIKKKTGEDTGNFPTVLAAYLQSLEVSLMSYLIVRAHGLFVPILWQHDGLTIKALYPETIPLMQQAVNDFCDTFLGGVRHLKLTVEEL